MGNPGTDSRPPRRSRTGRLTAALAAAAVGVGLLVAGPAPAALADVDATALCTRTLRYGSSGDCVKKLQRRLNNLGLNCGNQLTVDGVFGRLTRMRVYAFQGRNRLKVDGIVGDNTRRRLNNPNEGLSTICNRKVKRMIRNIWPDRVQDKAIRVARCESRLKVIAVGGPNGNGTLDFGVFQFNNGGTLQAYLPGDTYRKKVDASLHARPNIRAALRLWRARGWQPWSCRYA